MSGSINLGSYQTATGGQVSLSLDYNDALQATRLNGVNQSTADGFTATAVGENRDGSANPAASYSILLPPLQSAFVPIPATGPGAIQLFTNAKGKIAGVNVSTG